MHVHLRTKRTKRTGMRMSFDKFVKSVDIVFRGLVILVGSYLGKSFENLIFAAEKEQLYFYNL